MFVLQNASLYCVTIGVAQLHSMGFAHTDIKVDNIFVDKGIAFLDDLEYVTPVTAAARSEGRGLTGRPQSACDQDIAQLELFSGDVMRL
jgi:serine/threonine protein kinase